MKSVHYTIPGKCCEFCTTFIPLPDSSVSSVTNLIPCRNYPNPTEHSLEISRNIRMVHTRRAILEAVSRGVPEHVGEFMDERTTVFEPFGT